MSLPREPAIGALYVTISTPFATNTHTHTHVEQVLSDGRLVVTSSRYNIKTDIVMYAPRNGWLEIRLAKIVVDRSTLEMGIEPNQNQTELSG